MKNPRKITQFQKAWEEFTSLEAVNIDPLQQHTVEDLLFPAQFEIDLVAAGESDIDVRPHRRFVKKYDRAGLMK